MAFAVSNVIELIGPNGAIRLRLRAFFGKALRDMDVVIRVLIGSRRHLHEFRTGQDQHVFLFLALSLRDNDDGFISARIADQSQADSGIARSPFNDHTTGLQQALCLGVLNNGQRSPVLHGPAWVHEFALA